MFIRINAFPFSLADSVLDCILSGWVLGGAGLSLQLPWGCLGLLAVLSREKKPFPWVVLSPGWERRERSCQSLLELLPLLAECRSL